MRFTAEDTLYQDRTYHVSPCEGHDRDLNLMPYERPLNVFEDIKMVVIVPIPVTFKVLRAPALKWALVLVTDREIPRMETYGMRPGGSRWLNMISLLGLDVEEVL